MEVEAPLKALAEILHNEIKLQHTVIGKAAVVVKSLEVDSSGIGILGQ